MLVALAQAIYGRVSLTLTHAHYSSTPIVQKRVVFLRHNDTGEGSRCIITSDSRLDDYSSYVEGERFLVHLPQTKLLNAHPSPTGRGFADMRVEQTGEDVVLSFLLQPGASVSVNQNFNRLEINFLTNDGVKEKARAK